MNDKILDAFSRISLHTEYDNNGTYDCLNFEDDCKLVEDALQELDGIKNSKPNDAMKYLEVIGSVCPEEDVSAAEIFYEEYDTIKQYILKAQQQEKILSLINEKNVDIVELKRAETVEDYNLQLCGGISDPLTEEEFDTLKGWANND